MASATARVYAPFTCTHRHPAPGQQGRAEWAERRVRARALPDRGEHRPAAGRRQRDGRGRRGAAASGLVRVPLAQLEEEHRAGELVGSFPRGVFEAAGDLAAIDKDSRWRWYSGGEPSTVDERRCVLYVWKKNRSLPLLTVAHADGRLLKIRQRLIKSRYVKEQILFLNNFNFSMVS